MEYTQFTQDVQRRPDLNGHVSAQELADIFTRRYESTAPVNVEALPSVAPPMPPKVPPKKTPTAERPSKLNQALELASRGFRVFPLPVDDPTIPPKELKKPFLNNWPLIATSNPEKIRKLWGNAEYNIGIATGRGLVVLDYDMKDGQLGQKALDTHDMLGLPLDGMSATTATGGRHFLFKTDKTIQNSASKIAKNVDVRGEGGYVVAPGSTIHGVPYVSENLTNIVDLPELPEWMAQLATAARTKSSVNAKESLVKLDQPTQIAAATAWLRDEAPEAIEGSGGDTTTYKTACRVRDFGVTKATCLELLLDWNEHKAAPPWSYGDLSQKVDNAYSYATLPAGIADAKGELGDVSSELDAIGISITEAPKPKKLFYVDFGQAAETALETFVEPLIDDVLDCGALSAVYGRPKGGKTFTVLDMAFHVATGKPWQGHDVKQGLVVYVAAEGGRGIYKRLRALKIHNGVEGRIPFAIVPCPINLLDATREGDTRALIKLVRDAEDDYGRKAELVVIDTLSRALAGGDENSSTDMGTFIRHVDRIKAAVDSHLMIVHHSGKDQAKGMRGWSGILAAIDTEIEIHDGKFTNTAQRDRELLEPISFRLKSVEIGTDRKGKVLTSCVVETVVAPEFEIKLTPMQRELLAHVQSMTAAIRKNTQKTEKPKLIVSSQQVLDFILSVGKPKFKSLARWDEVSRALGVIGDNGLLQKHENNQWDISTVG
jgi:hypothetical protein